MYLPEYSLTTRTVWKKNLGCTFGCSHLCSQMYCYMTHIVSYGPTLLVKHTSEISKSMNKCVVLTSLWNKLQPRKNVNQMFDLIQLEEKKIYLCVLLWRMLGYVPAPLCLWVVISSYGKWINWGMVCFVSVANCHVYSNTLLFGLPCLRCTTHQG